MAYQKLLFVSSFCLWLTLTDGASASTTYTLDLATNVTQTIPVGVGERLEIEVINRAPSNQYEVEITKTRQQIEPLSMNTLQRVGHPTTCAALIDEISTEKSEEKVGELTNMVYSEPTCSAEQKQSVKRSTSIQLTNSMFTLEAGEKLTVKVVREKVEWKMTLMTPPRGKWQMSYGFNFVRNQDKQFFTQQSSSNAEEFVVTRENDDTDFDFVPSLYFTWLGHGNKNRPWGANWNLGPTFGLGFDFENPIVFAGLGASFNENVMLTAGAVFHPQKGLNGRYEAGQVLSENIESDQLSESTYDLNWYIGFSFRLGENPFKTAKDD